MLDLINLLRKLDLDSLIGSISEIISLGNLIAKKEDLVSLSLTVNFASESFVFTWDDNNPTNSNVKRLAKK